MLCSSWHTTVLMLCSLLPPSFLLVYSLVVVDLKWNAPSMVKSFLVSISVSFRFFSFHLTTAAGYRTTETAKVLIADILFLLTSSLLKILFTRFFCIWRWLAASLVVIVAKLLQYYQVFVAVVYAICLTLWLADFTGALYFAFADKEASMLCQIKCQAFQYPQMGH